MSGITELEDMMVAAHITPHEILEIKQKLNEVIRKVNELTEEVYRNGPNSK